MKQLNFDVAIVGGGVAGVRAAISAKKANPNLRVGIICEEKIMYLRPALSHVISGRVKVGDQISTYGSLENLGIHKLENWLAMSMDANSHILTVQSLGNGEIARIKFGNCVIAAGGTSFIPQIEGRELNGVFTLRKLSDALLISEYAKKCHRAVVVGAGFIGLEAAEALSKCGLEVTLVELMPTILGGVLEEEFSGQVAKAANKHGIKISTNSKIEKIGGDRRVEEVSFGGQSQGADMVIFATGVRPRTELVKDILKLAGNGAICVDSEMRTSCEGVYAAGDCSESLDFISRKNVYRPVGSIAARSAEIAGMNAGGVEKESQGFVRTQYNELFGLKVISMGLTVTEAKRLGIPAEEIDLIWDRKDLLHFIPLTSKNHLRMKAIISNKGAVIGFQAVGRGAVGHFSHLFLNLIWKRSKLEEVERIGLRPI
jgi:NADH oxidase (H2O2-forming)